MNRYPDHNLAGFKFAADRLRSEGHEVFNPGEHGEETLLKAKPELKHDREHFRKPVIRKDVLYIIDEADTIAFLPGWERGRGARVEHALGVYLDFRMIYLDMSYVKGWKP